MVYFLHLSTFISCLRRSCLISRLYHLHIIKSKIDIMTYNYNEIINLHLLFSILSFHIWTWLFARATRASHDVQILTKKGTSWIFSERDCLNPCKYTFSYICTCKYLNKIEEISWMFAKTRFFYYLQQKPFLECRPKGEFTMMASGTRPQAGSGLLPGLPGNLLLGNVKSAEIFEFVFFSSFLELNLYQ